MDGWMDGWMNGERELASCVSVAAWPSCHTASEVSWPLLYLLMMTMMTKLQRAVEHKHHDSRRHAGSGIDPTQPDQPRSSPFLIKWGLRLYQSAETFISPLLHHLHLCLTRAWKHFLCCHQFFMRTEALKKKRQVVELFPSPNLSCTR